MESKGKALLWLVILVAVSTSTLHSEPLDHRASFELGKLYARRMHRTWGWYLYGLAATPLVALTAGLDLPQWDVCRFEAAVLPLDPPCRTVYSTDLLGLAASLPGAAAALIRPAPRCGPGEELVDLGSFRAGYIREARRMSVCHVYYGELTLLAALLIGAGFLSALD